MQSRLESMLEQACNIGSGFVLALLVQTYFIVPVFHLPLSTGSNWAITSVFTVVSVVRGYCWRRFFNGRITRRK